RHIHTCDTRCDRPDCTEGVDGTFHEELQHRAVDCDCSDWCIIHPGIYRSGNRYIPLSVRCLSCKTDTQKTRSSIQSLVDMAPSVASVVRDGEELEVDIDDVEEGDRVIVRPGGKIPVDGIIVKGQANINEAAITGESNLKFKG